MFGTSKLVETARCNVHRIEAIWEFTVQHILSVAKHENTAVRKFAVESLGSLVQSVLDTSSDDHMEEVRTTPQRQ